MTIHIRPEDHVPAEHLQIDCFDANNGEIRLLPARPRAAPPTAGRTGIKAAPPPPSTGGRSNPSAAGPPFRKSPGARLGRPFPEQLGTR